MHVFNALLCVVYNRRQTLESVKQMSADIHRMTRLLDREETGTAPLGTGASSFATVFSDVRSSGRRTVSAISGSMSLLGSSPVVTVSADDDDVDDDNVNPDKVDDDGVTDDDLRVDHGVLETEDSSIHENESNIASSTDNT